MSGGLWAIIAGVGFGVFQTVNRRAVRGMDVFVATFLQLLISAIVLSVITLLSEDWARVTGMSARAMVNFALAGLFHFFIGWTFLNASQKKIGAARTGSLIATTPLWAAIFAAASLSEVPTIWTVIGIFVIIGGVFVVNSSRKAVVATGTATVSSGGSGGASVALGSAPRPAAPEIEPGLRPLLLGLAAALCWSISPIFIRQGLEELDSPVIGVTVGLVASVLGYAVVLSWRHTRKPLQKIETDALALKVLAGILVGLSTWVRWIALDLTTVAAVLALSLVSVPVVNILSPLVVGQHIEGVNAQVWLGSLVIIAGALVLILT